MKWHFNLFYVYSTVDKHCLEVSSVDVCFLRTSLMESEAEAIRLPMETEAVSIHLPMETEAEAIHLPTQTEAEAIHLTMETEAEAIHLLMETEAEPIHRRLSPRKRLRLALISDAKRPLEKHAL